MVDGQWKYNNIWVKIEDNLKEGCSLKLILDADTRCLYV